MGRRGLKNHLKRLTAPKHWMLNKLGGIWAPRPSCGPHKLRECVPLIILLRNRLKYALTRREALQIMCQRLVKVDGKVRTDANFPAGFMDVVNIERTNDTFRLLYDTKGRFVLHRVDAKEAKFKLSKVNGKSVGQNGIPFCSTHDGRTFRYVNPDISINDTLKVDLETGKVVDFVKFETGNLAMITGGANIGRVGEILDRERHPGSFDIVHLRDARGHEFATRIGNVFVIGKGKDAAVSLPKGQGVLKSIVEERQSKLGRGSA